MLMKYLPPWSSPSSCVPLKSSFCSRPDVPRPCLLKKCGSKPLTYLPIKSGKRPARDVSRCTAKGSSVSKPPALSNKKGDAARGSGPERNSAFCPVEFRTAAVRVSGDSKEGTGAGDNTASCDAQDIEKVPEGEASLTLSADRKAMGDKGAQEALHDALGVEKDLPTVVVVGGGLAGLSAAVEIIRTGGRVVLVDKCERLGGNSAKASSGINAAGSTPQRLLHIEDSPEVFKDDTIRSGKGRSTQDLVEVLVGESASAIDFLQDLGVDLSTVTGLGGHSHPRTHRNRADGVAMNLGYRIMSTLIKFVESQPPEKIRIVTGMRATALIKDEARGGRVVGVQCQLADAQTRQVSHSQSSASGESAARLAGEADSGKMEFRGDALVLATGGYSADRDGLVAQHVPSMRHLATTNGPFAVGDGVRLAEGVGAELVDMDQVQLHPTGFVDPRDPSTPTKFLAPEALRGCGGILLNREGKRFVNELDTRDKVVEAMFQNCVPLQYPSEGDQTSQQVPPVKQPVVAYMVLNEAAVEAFDPTIAQFYIKKGLLKQFTNANELSDAYHLPPEAVSLSLLSYGRGEAGVDPFGKKKFPVKFQSNERLYGAMVTPVLHYCMGGIRFGTSGEVYSQSGKPVVGMFAAGEVTGGLHGGNRLAGNSLLECVVFGRLAGCSALENAIASACPSSL